MNSSRFQYVSADLYRQIQKILPSGDGRQESYRPARVVLRDGKQLDYVCMIEASSYIQTWGVWPEDDSGKEQVSFDDIVSIEESSSRLPPAIANKLYKAGESGMGYCIFTLVFDDGTEQVCTSGNLNRFHQISEGKFRRQHS